jgi:hypothetical protein
MNQPPNSRTIVRSILFGICLIQPGTWSQNVSYTQISYSTPNPKIQVAILLDVSNSMDGLIEQAKAQLWSMVTVLGKIKCTDTLPDIEIALYEYGRPNNSVTDGFVKQISGFTHDIDKLFRDLYNLTTYGGDEYCGHAIYKSIDQLNWDTSHLSYKAIFIAGNEDFLQGDIAYTTACAESKKKGVIVNTIYCGSREQGIAEHWNLGAECGSGNFTNINQNAIPDKIITPYDSTLITLNSKLNQTYIPYAHNDKLALDSMVGVDTIPVTDALDPTRIIKYVVASSYKRLRNDAAWDLVDATERDSSFIDSVNLNVLPDSLKIKSRQELKQIVAAKSVERLSVQKQIQDIAVKRDSFYNTERIKHGADPTLQTEIEKIIRTQVKRFKMRID